MARTVAIGIQDFEKIRINQTFYIDKTAFIKEWWETNDDVTLITRPRRFGKTLNMDMLKCFFSNEYAGRGEIFDGLSIWENDEYRKLQGTYPVIFLSFAGIKQINYDQARKAVNQKLTDIYNRYQWLMKEDWFTQADKDYYARINSNMEDADAAITLNKLCEWLYRYYGKKCIILLDEYDTPMQEAYIHGFWDELVAYTRALFNNTFKTNPSLYRGVITGITRISKESIFSDLNNLEVITTTSEKYAQYFGFTEDEVYAALEEQNYPDSAREDVKTWYDGFTFGSISDIYNPWSITKYLSTGKLDTYWANTSANGLVGKLIREGDKDRKMEFEKLLKGECIEAPIDEQIIFNQLDTDKDAVWSLLLASGYLKCIKIIREHNEDTPVYRLTLTNLEVRKMFEKMVSGWFKQYGSMNEFVNAMFKKDLRSMNYYMNKVALTTFSYFDSGSAPSDEAPERFYHGFVLGLLVDNAKNYIITSNRESGFGRYDVIMEPKDKNKVAVIIEFKVYDKEYDNEDELSDTADNALSQIDEKQYAEDLLHRGIPEDNILKYGMAFQGKKCLIKTR